MKNPITGKLIQALRKTRKSGLSDKDLHFLTDYYHRISGQDYQPDYAEYFYKAAKIHLKLAQQKKPGELLIQIDQLLLSENEEKTLVSIVTDDQPFLINSLSLTLGKLNYRIDRTLHPTFAVERNSRNRIKEIHRYRSGEVAANRKTISHLESFIQFELEPIPLSEHQALAGALREVIENINIVTTDWRYMQQAVLSIAEMVERSQQGPSFAEYGALFRWMTEDHFAFIGYGEVIVDDKSNSVNIDGDSLCGILRAAHEQGLDIQDILPPFVASETSPVIFTKSKQRVYIHRANYLDCVLIDHDFGKPGKKNKRKRRVSCILGFLAGSTSTLPIASIPHLRNKAAFILSESSLRKGGYAYKELRNILETLPRELIFQIESKPLYGLCMTLLNQQERRKTRVHLHRNRCGHFFSSLVYIPRDLFDSRLRQRILRQLASSLEAEEVSFNVYFSESSLTRIHYTIHCDPKSDPKIKLADLEARVQIIARDWNENLLEVAREKHGLDASRKMIDMWRDGFPSNYQDRFNIDQALQDIEIFNQLGEDVIAPYFVSNNETNDHLDQASFKIYCWNNPLPLSDVLPILENMGVRVMGEHPYKITTNNGKQCWINDFNIVRRDKGEFQPGVATNFEQTFLNVWTGATDNDGFNQLTLLAGLDWRLVSLVRTYFRYLKQIRFRYSGTYIIESITKNAVITLKIVDLFVKRFDPSNDDHKDGKLLKKIVDAIGSVSTLDEERILSAFLDALNATSRTNFYQTTEGNPKPYISLKLNSREIPRIPEPAPKHEVFVYSPDVEGVHLRGGDVARGGLRWSERPEDFRTEVLGLVKAQRVKNAVIVPVGSKGGFVAKKLPTSDREAIQAEVIRCYQMFISGLLDITDNIVNNKIVPPINVVRRDQDDPYLVVAADKGTATFSDIANALSIEYKFWLGDAFASGGSVGYDHKKMGITARGAWESVKRHFRERNKDIQNENFTVVGIGDMGGDVFGNGMLLSPCIQLVAAFNHMHIFLDPTPNAEKTYAERKRLFDLPRSSWTDYNNALISKGGGIYERSAKSISISAEAQKALSTTKDKFTPDELINVILKAKVELLWNGGIGTYVKASFESHGDAQDRNNDAVRVDADQLRVAVIGEGGNLGLTQSARIEFNKHNGRCYTDAIDNSAGVDTSDHEVNIKILLNQAIETGALAASARNKLLAKMEQEIANQVLQNNYMQTQILSLETNSSEALMPQQIRSIRLLEEKELLNRGLEYLAEEPELLMRQEAGQWFTSAELAVLLSYSKMDLYNGMLASKAPDDPYFEQTIRDYFPRVLAKKFPALIQLHRLKREIIATQITNDLVGTVGANFHLRIAEITSAEIGNIVKAYIVARDILEIPRLQSMVQRLDNEVATHTQQSILLTIAHSAETLVNWILRNHDCNQNIDKILSVYNQNHSKVIEALRTQVNILPNQMHDDIKQAIATSSLSKGDKQFLRVLPALSYWCDVVSLSNRLQQDLKQVSHLYFLVGQHFELFWLRDVIQQLTADNHWKQRARFSLTETLNKLHSDIIDDIAGANGNSLSKQGFDDWRKQKEPQSSQAKKMITQLRNEADIDFAMLSVLINDLSRLVA